MPNTKTRPTDSWVPNQPISFPSPLDPYKGGGWLVLAFIVIPFVILLTGVLGITGALEPIVNWMIS